MYSHVYYLIGYVDLFHAVRISEFAFRVTRVVIYYDVLNIGFLRKLFHLLVQILRVVNSGIVM